MDQDQEDLYFIQMATSSTNYNNVINTPTLSATAILIKASIASLSAKR